MNSKLAVCVTVVTAMSLMVDDALGRGGRGGGGGARGGGGSFHPPSRPAPSRPAPSRPSSGGALDRSPARGSASQLPSSAHSKPAANRTVAESRPSVATRPSRPEVPQRPAARPEGRPTGSDVSNFLGIPGGADRPSARPADRAALADTPPAAGERVPRPDQRPDWEERSRNRSPQWEQRVDNRHNAWTQREGNRAAARQEFQQTRENRWSQIEDARGNRENWRDENRQARQEHREQLWEYRGDRAEEVWDQTRDLYDDVFDDRWWRAWGWGAVTGLAVGAIVDPWWWWGSATYEETAKFVTGVEPEPAYSDYGSSIVFEGDTVYVNNEPVPAAQYSGPAVELASTVPQPPAPLPPEAEPSAQPESAQAKADWMPLGVFALVQEKKGDPVMFFQISINRDGVLSGAYSAALTGDQRPVAGKVDKATQRAAWRIGESTDAIFESSLGNLTLEVSPVAVHFGKSLTQTWLLVRLPEPGPAAQKQALPKAPTAPPQPRA